MGELVSTTEVKNYLEVDFSDDDTLIGNLITRIEARLEAYIGTPITAETYTEYFDGGKRYLFLNHMPIDNATVTVTDLKGTGTTDATDDAVEDSTLYRIYPEKGMIARSTSNGVLKDWETGALRWKVEYDAGLDQMTDWTAAQEDLAQSVIDLISDLYERRIPTTTREDFGYGQSISFVGFRGSSLPTLPTRVKEVWDRYKPVY